MPAGPLQLSPPAQAPDVGPPAPTSTASAQEQWDGPIDPAAGGDAGALTGGGRRGDIGSEDRLPVIIHNHHIAVNYAATPRAVAANTLTRTGQGGG